MSTRWPVAAGESRDVWAPGKRHPAVVIVNTGGGLVLVDDAPAPGTAGLPLSPGESLPWDADRALSLTAPAGDGEVIVTENTGQSTGAQAIAAAILAEGLAGDIADAIRLVGVPSIDSPAVLVDGEVQPTAPSAAWAIDVTRWQSISLVVSVTRTTGNPSPRTVPVTIGWATPSGASLGSETLTVLLGTATEAQTATLRVTRPCRGATCAVAVSPGSSLPDWSVRLTALGSMRDATPDTEASTVDGSQGGTALRWDGNVAVVGRTVVGETVQQWMAPAISGGQVWRDVPATSWPGREVTWQVAIPSPGLPAPVALDLLAWPANAAAPVRWASSVMPTGTTLWLWPVTIPPGITPVWSLVGPSGGIAAGATVTAAWSRT